jgi:hypothetical protein
VASIGSERQDSLGSSLDAPESSDRGWTPYVRKPKLWSIKFDRIGGKFVQYSCYEEAFCPPAGHRGIGFCHGTAGAGRCSLCVWFASSGPIFLRAFLLWTWAVLRRTIRIWIWLRILWTWTVLAPRVLPRIPWVLWSKVLCGPVQWSLVSLIPSPLAGHSWVFFEGPPIVRGPSELFLALLALGRPLICRVRAHCETGV